MGRVEDLHRWTSSTVDECVPSCKRTRISTLLVEASRSQLEYRCNVWLHEDPSCMHSTAESSNLIEGPFFISPAPVETPSSTPRHEKAILPSRTSRACI